MPVADLNGSDDQDAVGRKTSVHSDDRGIVAVPEGDVRLVDMDGSGKRTPVRVDHRPAELVEQQPGRLVRPDADLRPELQGRNALLVGGHEIGGQEPGAQRQPGAMHHGAGDQRDCDGNRFWLGPSGRSGGSPGSRIPRPMDGFEPPALPTAAPRTNESFGPPLAREMAGA